MFSFIVIDKLSETGDVSSAISKVRVCMMERSYGGSLNMGLGRPGCILVEGAMPVFLWFFLLLSNEECAPG